MLTIYIDGYDFTYDLKSIPALDQTSSEWGVIDKTINNDLIELQLPISYSTFFMNGRDITAIPVKIYNNIAELVFNGAITCVESTRTDLNLTCQSFTTILSNSIITGSTFAYTKEDAYPIDVVLELLDLAEEVIKAKFPTETFTMNSVSYQTAYNLQSFQNLTFNVYCDAISYIDLISKLCEVSCAILYIKNGEFFFQVYQRDIASSIELDDIDLVSYPTISQEASDTTTFNEVDIRFGDDVSILEVQGIDADTASKTIIMSVGIDDLEVSTTYLSTAQYIKDLYDDIYTNNKQYIEVYIRKALEDIIGKNSYINYDDVIYRITTITSDSNLYTFIRGEAVL